ncbi:MAG: hypothetical protein LW716_07755, partial [Microcystis sp. 53602_E8]|nr:hypothetical protein [Microcystis sp. 53602_E8]
TIDKNRPMSFSIRVPSLITPVHYITQTEEPRLFLFILPTPHTPHPTPHTLPPGKTFCRKP